MKYDEIRAVIRELIKDDLPHTNGEIITAIYGKPCTSHAKINS